MEPLCQKQNPGLDLLILSVKYTFFAATNTFLNIFELPFFFLSEMILLLTYLSFAMPLMHTKCTGFLFRFKENLT